MNEHVRWHHDLVGERVAEALGLVWETREEERSER